MPPVLLYNRENDATRLPACSWSTTANFAAHKAFHRVVWKRRLCARLHACLGRLLFNGAYALLPNVTVEPKTTQTRSWSSLTSCLPAAEVWGKKTTDRNRLRLVGVCLLLLYRNFRGKIHAHVLTVFLVINSIINRVNPWLPRYERRHFPAVSIRICQLFYVLRQFITPGIAGRIPTVLALLPFECFPTKKIFSLL